MSLRSMIGRDRRVAGETAPRMAIPVARHYKSGLDPEAARILDMARLGLDVSIGGPAGTGKSAIVKRVRAMALASRKIESHRADGSVTVEEARPDAAILTIVDEAGLSAKDPADAEGQVLTTFDYLQTTRLERPPNWRAGRPEQRSETVVTRISYRRKSNQNPSMVEDGGPATLASPDRPDSEAGDRIRVQAAYPDPWSTALAMAFVALKNATINIGVKQTIATNRREVAEAVRDILTLEGIVSPGTLAEGQISFTHPMLIQGDESDITIVEFAGLDELAPDDAMRLVGVIMSRSTQQVDIVMPRLSSEPDEPGSLAATRAASAYLSSIYETRPAGIAPGLAVPAIPKESDPDPILSFAARPEGVLALLRGKPVHHTRFLAGDRPLEGDRREKATLLHSTDLSEGACESAIVHALDDLRPIGYPHFADVARKESNRREREEKNASLQSALEKTGTNKRQKEKRK